MTAEDDTGPHGRELGQPPGGHQASDAREPFWDLKASHWVEVFLTIVLICIGLLQSRIYIRQTTIMDKQASIAAKQNQITTEASRAVVNLHSFGQATNADGYDYSFKIGNDGNVSTAGLSITVDCARSDRAYDEPFNLLAPTHGGPVPDLIPPKHEIEISPAIRTDCRVTFAEMERIAGIVKDVEHLYFLGSIKYRDSIDPATWHVTQFAKELVIDVVTNGLQHPIGSALSRGQHNCADDDCPKLR